MAGPKRHKPYNPALAAYQQQQAVEADTAKRSRIATAFNKGIAAHIVFVDVDDPYDGNGGKIRMARQTRDDPIYKMFERQQISVAQLEGGRAFQRDFEVAERGPKAIDFTREAVDGGLMPDAITEAQQKAARSLSVAYRALGLAGSTVATDVLIHRRTMAQIGESRGMVGERWERYFGMRFREALDTLAEVYGFAMQKR